MTKEVTVTQKRRHEKLKNKHGKVLQREKYQCCKYRRRLTKNIKILHNILL